MHIATLFRTRLYTVGIILAILSAVLAMVILLLDILGVASLSNLVGMYTALSAVIAIFYIIALQIETLRYKNENTRAFIGALILLLIGAVFEAVNFFLCITDSLLIFEITVVLFMFTRLFNLLRSANLKLKQLAQTEKDLMESKIDMLMGQIKPHFIYNTLNAISGLCLINPQKADEAIIELSSYLRANVDTLQKDTPVAFEQELSSVIRYINIVKIRFEDKVNFVVDAKYTDFTMPPLTIQPLVENAIKHGILPKDGTGTIVLRSYLQGKKIIVIVEDNGVGFDKATVTENVALKNIKYRLGKMTNAVLVVSSKVGVGTVAKIIIPKNSSNNSAESGNGKSK